jgi:hypothetical protein
VSRRIQRPSRRRRHANASRPDFARLYAGDVPTPRMAHALWQAAKQLTHEWQGEFDDPDDYDELLIDLPMCVEDVADRSWMRRFAQCLRDVLVALEAADLARLPTCVGDEIALFLVFDRAAGEAFLWVLDNDPYHQQLPALAGDEWYLGVAGLLFPDSVTVDLIKAQEDRGAYDEPAFNRRMAGARMEAWFPPPSSRSRRDGTVPGGCR